MDGVVESVQPIYDKVALAVEKAMDYASHILCGVAAVLAIAGVMLMILGVRHFNKSAAHIVGIVAPVPPTITPTTDEMESQAVTFVLAKAAVKGWTEMIGTGISEFADKFSDNHITDYIKK